MWTRIAPIFLRELESHKIWILLSKLACTTETLSLIDADRQQLKRERSTSQYFDLKYIKNLKIIFVSYLV